MVHTERKNDRVENWRDIIDYENLYQGSNFGRVRSVDRWVKSKSGSVRLCKGRILKPSTDKNGYLKVDLWKNNKQKIHLVHRLVAEAFLPNPDNLQEVNHKDENKQNNNVENLEWCDRTYNVNYGTAIEKMIKKKSKPVLQYTLDSQFVREWKSAKQAEREGGFNSICICMCCKGKIKKHKDFIWRYK